jgi:hypothetical protein
MEQVYKSITEVRAEEMPSRNGRTSKWEHLATELLLRLEQTPASKALRVEFVNKDELRKGRASLQKWFRKYGVSVVTGQLVENGSAVLFVKRGPNYQK